MKKNATELVFILDRSGSMSGLEADTIGGFNSMIEKQKQEAGEATVTTILFDNYVETLHDRADLQKIQPMTNKEYYVRGSTALLDAVKAAGHIGIGADRAVNYHCDPVGTALNYAVVSATVSNMRQGKGVAAEWKQRIEDDFKGRKSGK